jgi:hypothetical protein
MIFNELVKVKPLMDQLCEGLQNLGVLSLIQAFPKPFYPLFVAPQNLTAEMVTRIINVSISEASPDEERTWEMTKQFLHKRTEGGKFRTLISDSML